MNNEIIVAFIDSVDGKITVYGNEYSFIFTKSENHMCRTQIKPDDAGFIWAKKANGGSIGIHAGQVIDLKDVRRLNTWCYIEIEDCVEDANSYYVDGLSLINGSLKSIFSCNAIEPDLDSSGNHGITYKYNNDAVEYNTDIGEKVCWKFASRVVERTSIMEGNALENKDVILNLEFGSKVNICVIRDYYRISEQLLSFLSFHREIGFEKIEILKREKYGMSTIGEVYIKNSDVEIRNYVDVINVGHLNEIVFNNMVNTLAKEDLTKKGLPLEILPDSKNDEFRITVGRIRAICSALEMELDAKKVSGDRNVELENLVKEVKKIIKEHRKTRNSLSSKTYDTIFGSISHWDNPLAERINDAWKEHVEVLRPFLKRYWIDVFENDIDFFVKTRNNITHNGLASLDNKVVNTAFALMALTYTCTLERMGMDSANIKDIMGKKLFV